MLPAPPWARTSFRFGYTVPAKEWSTLDMYWLASGSVPPTYDPFLAAQAFFTAFEGDLLPIMGMDVQAIGANVVIASGTNRHGASVPGSASGGSLTASLPEEVAAVVAMASTAPGRHGNGRFRLSGIAEEFVTGNHLLPSAVTLINTLGGDMIAGWTSDAVTWTPALLNKAAGTLSPVVNVFPVGLVGSARRRAPRF